MWKGPDSVPLVRCFIFIWKIVCFSFALSEVYAIFALHVVEYAFTLSDSTDKQNAFIYPISFSCAIQPCPFWPMAVPLPLRTRQWRFERYLEAMLIVQWRQAYLEINSRGTRLNLFSTCALPIPKNWFLIYEYRTCRSCNFAIECSPIIYDWEQVGVRYTPQGICHSCLLVVRLLVSIPIGKQAMEWLHALFFISKWKNLLFYSFSCHCKWFAWQVITPLK